MEKNWTCPGHWSHIIINKLYVRYTRKHSKDSITYPLYIDTTAEVNVVYSLLKSIIRIIKYSQTLCRLFHLPHSCFSWSAKAFSPTISSVVDNFSSPSSYVEKLVSFLNHLLNISNTQLDILS